MQNLQRMGKNDGPILSRLWTEVHVVMSRCGKSLLVAKALADCLYHVSFQRYRQSKLTLSCEIVEKSGFGAPICTGGDTPHFEHAFSNRIYFRACVTYLKHAVSFAFVFVLPLFLVLPLLIGD